MTIFDFCLADSLEKVLPGQAPPQWEEERLQGFLGETLSLQLAYFCRNDDFGESDCRFTVSVRSGIPDCIRLRKVELVPCAYPCHGTRDEDYLTGVPGLYPDLLLPLPGRAPIKAVAGQWRSLWIDVEAPEGEHQVRLELADPAGGRLKTLMFGVRVFGAALPPQTLLHTEWFHADCLADYYKVPVFSEAHWRVIGNFMESAVRHGVNMLLTPLFTPPLDTAKGGERTTVQLVGVKRGRKGYEFDFSLLRRWICLCEEKGIRFLEMSHLFTQWGAARAPKIMGRVNGGPEEQLFGWHTPAVGGEYTVFLHCFLPALKDFLSRAGWLGRTWFHISDEPHDEEVETFSRARKSVAGLLEGCQVMDALSSFEIYKKGVVERPVASVDHIAPFLESGAPHLWAYYCTAQALEVPNRFIAMPSTRNRVLGTLLYYFGIEGFLHWGFNFYNSQRSESHIDPYRVTDAGEAFPSGDPFLVYPAPDGTAYDSIRGMVLRQALSDLRCLQLLEKLQGKQAAHSVVEALAGKDLSFRNYPRTKDFFYSLRQALGRKMGLI